MSTRPDNEPTSVYVPMNEECALATDLPWYRDTLYRNVQASRGGIVAESAATADLIIIFERWMEKDERVWDQLLDDRFLIERAPICYVVSHDDYTVGLMPGCYTSLTTTRFDRRWHSPCGYPAVYHWDPTIDELSREMVIEPRWLYSFRGSTDSHPVRRRLAQSMAMDASGIFSEVNQDFRSHTAEQRRDYVREIMSSNFVLCPRGYSPSTYRMYEVMQLGRCPVVISDDWVPPSGPNWSECIIRLPERSVSNVVDTLRDALPKAREMGAAARREWDAWFSESARFVGYYDKIRDLQSLRRSQNSCSAEFLRHRLKSWKFQWNAGWTPIHRMARKLRIS